MAEGFEPYHVPQQSRRDKLRVIAQNHHHHHQGGVVEHSTANLQGLLPLYDPSLLSSDLLTCTTTNTNTHEFHHHHHHHHNQNPQLTEPGCKGSAVKEESVNLMGFVGGIINGASSSSSSAYLDPNHSLPLNPNSIQDMNSNPFLFTPQSLQNLRDFDQSYNNGSEVVVFKPEPLSLSLSSHHQPTHHQTNLPLELNLQRYGSGSGAGYVIPGIVNGSASASNDVSRSSVPLGPFTGYASILKGSRFLKPAQQLLEEFCEVAGRGIYAEKVTADSALMDSPMESLSASGIVDDRDPLSCEDGAEIRSKKSRLISMLNEVYRRYRQYYQQMQTVVTSFECVAGLGNAAPFANLAIKAMSKHFRCLKNAITDQLQFNYKAHATLGNDEAPRLGNADRGLFCQRPVHSSGFLEHQPVWRPQRGLPERAVTVLRAWLFEHFLHPYPTDTDKLMLAKQTGLSRSQVSNWFINARVRLWKPMVEEIHTLETRQAQKASQRDERSANRSSDQLTSANSLVSDNPSTSTQRAQDTPSKRTRNELPDIPVGNEEPRNLSYNNFLSHPHHMGVGVSMAGGNSGVSLTLGLHQNNGIGMSEPFPINAVQRFGLGLETNGEGYVIGGFESHNRHFERDVMGGQLLHDFVG